MGAFSPPLRLTAEPLDARGERVRARPGALPDDAGAEVIELRLSEPRDLARERDGHDEEPPLRRLGAPRGTR